jgi:hypothetical protein
VLSMLPTEGQRNFFTSEFLENPDLTRRKFGNQAVGNAPDLKCAHALVAQALVPGLRPCPLGEVVAAFIVWLGRAVAASQEAATASADATEPLPATWHKQLIPLFKQFAGKFFAEYGKSSSAPASAAAEREKQQQLTDSTDLVKNAQIVVDSVLEETGEGKGRRRKRRTD